MSDGTIRIRVGASLVQREVEATFGTIEKIADRTGKNVAKALGAGGGASSNTGGAAMARGFRAAATEADKASREMERSFARQVKSAERASKEEYRAFLKASQDKKRIADKEASDREKFAARVAAVQDRFLRQETRNAEREAARREKLEERAAKRIQRDREKFADRTSHRAVKFLFPNPIGAFGMASRIGHDVLRGAGVDFSVAGSVGRAVDVETITQQLSNQGYRKGEKGEAGTRVSQATLEAEARKVGKDLSIDPMELLHAQMKFLDVTGELGDSRRNMKGLAEIAAATNTDFTAMAEAAGNVSRHLEEGPDKAEKLLAIMRVMAGQGKVGSIEIKDFATQMAKIAALAPKFGGDVSENITKLTTIAQLSRAEGGSASPAQAATATARFVDIFTTPARMKGFRALGIDPYLDKNHTQLKDPFEIIRQSLTKTKGDALKMADLFKSVMAQRGIAALTTAYNRAGGGKAGLDAVDAQFSIFGKESAIKPEEVDEANKLRQQTSRAQAQAFQNELDQVVASMKGELVPALKEFAPLATKGAHALGELVTWAAHHKMEAVGLAIAAAIGRAGIESAFRAGIERLLTGPVGVGAKVGAGGLGGGGGLVGNLGAALTIASVAVATFEVGKMFINEYFDQKAREQNAEATATGNDGAALANAVVAMRDYGTLNPEQRKNLEGAKLHETSQLEQLLAERDQLQYRLDNGDTNVDQKSIDDDNRKIGELKDELARMTAILSRNLNVTVTNADDFYRDQPRVFAPGRQLTPGNLPAYLLR